MIVQCCACHRVRVDNVWRFPTPRELRQSLSHGYCPACHKNVAKEMALYANDPERIVKRRVKKSIPKRVEPFPQRKSDPNPSTPRRTHNRPSTARPR